MPDASTVARRLAPAERNLGIDTARGLALFGMMVTHILTFVSAEGTFTPAVWFAGRSSALFAVLAGFSVVLSTQRVLTRPGVRPWAAASAGLVLRGLLISIIGLLLGMVSSSIAVILVFYGVMFALAPLFLRLPTLALGLLAPLWLALAPVLSMALRRGLELSTNYIVPTPGDLLTPRYLVSDLLLTGYYPVLPWMGYLLLGMFLARLDWRSARTAGTAALLGLGTALLAKAASSLLLTAGGRAALEASVGPVPDPEPGSLEYALQVGSYGVTPTDTWWWLTIAGPHSATPFDLFHTSGVAVAVLGLCALAAILLGRRSWLLAPLSAPGSMPLTIYTGHIVFLEISRLAQIGGLTELVVHVGLAVLFALAWRGLVSPRGPLEWPLSSAVRAVQRGILGPAPAVTDDRRAAVH